MCSVRPGDINKTYRQQVSDIPPVPCKTNPSKEVGSRAAALRRYCYLLHKAKSEVIPQAFVDMPSLPKSPKELVAIRKSRVTCLYTSGSAGTLMGTLSNTLSFLPPLAIHPRVRSMWRGKSEDGGINWWGSITRLSQPAGAVSVSISIWYNSRKQCISEIFDWLWFIANVALNLLSGVLHTRRLLPSLGNKYIVFLECEAVSFRKPSSFCVAIKAWDKLKKCLGVCVRLCLSLGVQRGGCSSPLSRSSDLRQPRINGPIGLPWEYLRAYLYKRRWESLGKRNGTSLIWFLCAACISPATTLAWDVRSAGLCLMA